MSLTETNNNNNNNNNSHKQKKKKRERERGNFQRKYVLFNFHIYENIKELIELYFLIQKILHLTKLSNYALN